MFSKLWYLFLLALVLTPSLNPSGVPGALAQLDDEVGEDADEMEVEDEEEETVTVPDQKDEDAVKTDVLEEDEDEDAEVDEVKKIGPHPDASTTLIFVNRPSNQLAAGELVETLIGFTNEADTEFIVTAVEGSFRYPQDFSYFIQNFTVDSYETFIQPQTQVSFQYNFLPSESFYARPFGLTVNVHYKDLAGEIYRDAVFNDTVNIVEAEESFDGETFFMYVFMVSGISLLMFIIHYVYTTTVRKTSKSKKPVETGTQKNNDVDYSWLPEGAHIPGSPKKSPRMRKNKSKSTQ